MQKLKLLHLLRILQEQTDEHHPLSRARIGELLEEQGIKMERKTFYDDIEALRLFGVDIETQRAGREVLYYVGSRDFEMPELCLLVDAVQSSRFISHQKSLELIRKVENLCSKPQAHALERQVYITHRNKTDSKTVYYNIDAIHTAIGAGRQISFLYYDWVLAPDKKEKLERRYRRGGERYKVSPMALIWDDEKYYLVAYDPTHEMVRHYRVDKMEKITMTAQAREKSATNEQFDVAKYAQKLFCMFGGEEKRVVLRFANRLLGVALDQFGRHSSIQPDGEDHFLLRANVMISPQFLAWLFGLGDEVQLLAPQEAVDLYKQQAQKILETYQQKN